MIIQLGVSHQRDVTTIVAITPTEDGGMLVLYTGTHLEGDSTGTIEIDLSKTVVAKPFLKHPYWCRCGNCV